MDALTLLVLSLATYRLATDLAWEDGPFELYARGRGLVAARAGRDHWLTTGVNCPICLSFWIAFVGALLLVVLLGVPLVWLVGYWLAAAGAASFLARQGSGS